MLFYCKQITLCGYKRMMQSIYEVIKWRDQLGHSVAFCRTSNAEVEEMGVSL